jgi:hypothetical protein
MHHWLTEGQRAKGTLLARLLEIACIIKSVFDGKECLLDRSIRLTIHEKRPVEITSLCAFMPR